VLLKTRFRALALILVVAVPLFMVNRIYKRWVERPQVPIELLGEVERFQEIIPKGDRVLVTGDVTPYVFLYFLNRKGMTYRGDVPDEIVHDLREKGFRWLVDYRNSAGSAAARESLAKEGTIGDFVIYRLVKD
jgi:hypothetical protein